MENVNEMSVQELESVLAEKKKQQKEQERKKREAYEKLRADLITRLQNKVHSTIDTVKDLFQFVSDETGAFKAIMAEYGQLREVGQMSYKLEYDNFRIWVKCNKVKKFDERADVAAARLFDFLQTWIKQKADGENNPMYKLAMTFLERNRYGDLDYKSISKLYDLESNFDRVEYSDIMKLFKESNVIEGTATNYYFEERTPNGVWRRLEPSFNRL